MGQTNSKASCLHPQLSRDDTTDTAPYRRHQYRRCVSDAISFDLQWSRSKSGVNAVGRCIVIDLFNNSKDAENYAQAFKSAGFEIQFLDHPSVEVGIGKKHTYEWNIIQGTTE